MATYDSQTAQINRQRALAEALRQTGNEALPASIRTGGRFDAPVSGWEYANKALSTVLGAYNQRQANQKQAKLDQEDKAVLANLLEAKRAADAPEAPVNNEVPDVQYASNVPEAAVPETKAQRVAKLQAATLRGQQFGGSAAPYAEEVTKRELFPAEQAPYTLNEGDVRYDKNNNPIAAAPQKPLRESPEDRALINVADPKAAKGYRTIKRSDWKGEQLYEKPNAGSAAGSQEIGLSPEALHNGALDMIRVGPAAMFQYVSRSSADKPTRDALNNEVIKIMKSTGMTNNDVARFRGRVQGELKSQKGLIEMGNAVDSYEKLARFNGERLLQLVDGVDTTGVPALEGAIRHAKAKGGDVDAAEFQSVLKNYQTEVARVINNPRLVGQLTDTQIEEMKKVVDGAASAPQLRRVINRLNLEMDVRSGSIREQIDKSGSALDIPGETPPTAPAATTTPPVTKTIGGKTYKKTGPGPNDWEAVE